MADYVIRQAEAGDENGIATVQITTWAEAYEGILPDRLLAPWRPDELQRMWHRRIGDARGDTCTIVAADKEGAIVGFGTCGKTRRGAIPAGAEISLLYILRSVQRLGLGRDLMRALARSADKHGHAMIGLWVLADNESATRFYEALGGILTIERKGQFGGHRTRELGYVWPTGILSRSGSLKDAAARR